MTSHRDFSHTHTMKRPGAASRQELERVVDIIQTILYPGGREDLE